MMPNIEIPNLTESQKVDVQVVNYINALTNNLNSIAALVADMKIIQQKHHTVLVEGNGVPSIQERMRVAEGFIAEVRYWMKFIIGLGLAGFISNAFIIIMWAIKQMP